MLPVNSSFMNHILEEHAEISGVLQFMQDNINHKEILKQKLIELKHFGHNHLKFEEREVYTKYPLNRIDDEIMINRLLNEHQEIQNQVRQIVFDIKKERTPRLHLLTQVIERHHKLENEFLYPALDAFLSDETKAQLLKKAKNR